MSDKKTIVMFSGDLDKVMAGLIIANGAAAMGSEVTMFFTFWGINVLRKAKKIKVKKDFMEKMFGWMMPRGAEKLGLSKMNFGGMGALMMKDIMKKKNVNTLPELIESAQMMGVKMIVCTMSMDVMGIKEAELIDGLEFAGVASYLGEAEESNVNLFI
ncbi:MAG: DsrE/DsrF/DrsH-like family protein [Alkaliphilus sp.]|nr:DsrE/DsrF/DrsH-like family protein [Alkaliphilus sp.]